MSSTSIDFSWSVNGVPADVTSVVLADPANAYGVRRTDTNAIVVAAGTALAHNGTGLYSYAFTDPAQGLTYSYYLKVVYVGATYFLPRTQSGPGAISRPCYLGLADARALAATVPAALLTNFNSANDSDATFALLQGSNDVDQGMRYQGRRYDMSNAQKLEFPRTAYEANSRVREQSAGIIPLPPFGPGWTDTVWDWDTAHNVAVVPPNVLLAVLYQANWILGGVGEERLNEQHAGVVATSGGGISEQYDKTAEGPRTGLCRRSYQLLWPYRLVSGRLL